jgi:hypothetical protein
MDCKQTCNSKLKLVYDLLKRVKILPMQVIKLIALIASTLLISGCNCKPSYMSDNFVVRPEDKNLNCQQVIYAINESEFWMKNAHERCKQPHVFSKFLPCTPMVRLDAMRNKYILLDRIKYLRSLYTIKGCDSTLELRMTSIERQSKQIGYASDRSEGLEERFTNKSMVARDGRVIADIPTNIG